MADAFTDVPLTEVMQKCLGIHTESCHRLKEFLADAEVVGEKLLPVK